MKLRTLAFATLSAGLVFAAGAPANKYSKQDYINHWKEVAQKNQMDFKIPASITLAQGILESGFGNSNLAQKANNHFGIKCHNWSGETFFMDDDRKDECFRKYSDASQSYSDHSTFLTSRSRYGFLFDYEITDYKSWAKGLKKAGYATNPKYPALLIKIIEENGLAKYDQLNYQSVEADVISSRPVLSEVSSSSSKLHLVCIHENKIKFVRAKKGDTFYKIAKEKEMALWQLYKYNDFGSKKDVLNEGDIVFLQPKKGKAKSKSKTLKISKPISLRAVSQSEGIQLKKLKKLNPSFLNVDKEIALGAEVFLK